MSSGLVFLDLGETIGFLGDQVQYQARRGEVIVQSQRKSKCMATGKRVECRKS